MKAKVYAIINLQNNHRYVGVTAKNIEERMKMHWFEANRGSSSEIYKALRECGKESFAISILEYCSYEQRFEREAFWIDKLNTLHPNGYNTANSHLAGGYQSDIVKEKKSIAQFKRWQKENAKKEHSLLMKKIFQDPEIRRRHSEGLKKSWTEERRIKSAEQCKNNINLHKSKGWEIRSEIYKLPVIIFDMIEHKESEFKSMTEAAKHLNLSVSTLSGALKRDGILLKRFIIKSDTDHRSFTEIKQEIDVRKAQTIAEFKQRMKRLGPWNKGLKMKQKDN